MKAHKLLKAQVGFMSLKVDSRKRQVRMSKEIAGHITVWFSCGAASAVAAKKTIEMYGSRCQIRIVNNPVAEEHPDNRRFLKDVQDWLGVTIEIAMNSRYPLHSAVQVWSDRKFMSGNRFAPCTTELKKIARQQWERSNKSDWLVLGFTFDESHRATRFIKYERENLIPILVDQKISKTDCFKIINDAGLKLPEIYRLGYPNANCIGCVKASSPTYWNHVRKMHPLVFESRATQSRNLGAKLVRVKNKRIFLDELKESDAGKSMKSMDFDCGVFCEEAK